MKTPFDDIDVNFDEEDDNEIYGQLEQDHSIDLDDPEEISDEYDDETEIKHHRQSLIDVLRDELKLKEYERGSLDFKYNGIKFSAVPMCEINPNKFVFKTEPDGKLKSFTLSEIVVL